MPSQKPQPARKGNRRIFPKPRSSLHGLIPMPVSLIYKCLNYSHLGLVLLSAVPHYTGDANLRKYFDWLGRHLCPVFPMSAGDASSGEALAPARSQTSRSETQVERSAVGAKSGLSCPV